METAASVIGLEIAIVYTGWAIIGALAAAIFWLGVWGGR